MSTRKKNRIIRNAYQKAPLFYLQIFEENNITDEDLKKFKKSKAGLKVKKGKPGKRKELMRFFLKNGNVSEYLSVFNNKPLYLTINNKKVVLHWKGSEDSVISVYRNLDHLSFYDSIKQHGRYIHGEFQKNEFD